MEKRKAKAQRELVRACAGCQLQAGAHQLCVQEYMAERAQEFRFDYMDVSQATDARLQAEPQLVGQDFTHQEFMDYILRGKQEPFIPVRPDAAASSQFRQHLTACIAADDGPNRGARPGGGWLGGVPP